MIINRLNILFGLLILPFIVKTQESKFGIKFSGYVKNDIFYDNRQVVNIREGHFLLYPEDKSFDENKNDLNNKSTFNMLSIQSRLKGVISGPDAFGAKTSGVIEADFFGNENANFIDANGFRLRHAFVKINWKTTEILAGQYWHPMFIAESFSGVVSFNTGAPFQPFSRNPQLRITQKLGSLSFVATAFSQRDFQSTGPDGLNSDGTVKPLFPSTRYLRNSAIPDVNFQIQFQPDSTEHLFGLGADYKTIVPRLYSEVVAAPATTPATTSFDTINKTLVLIQTPIDINKYKVDEKISSFSAFVYAKIKLKPITIKFEGIYAQNATDLTMIGGYAIKQINNPITEAADYTNIATASAWLDIQTNGKKIQAAIFVGYSQNLGSNDVLYTDKIKKPVIYARGSNIAYLYRVAPRIIFTSGKLNLALEGEYTFAMYGTANGNGKGKVTNGRAVANMRPLLAFIYNF